LNEYEDPPDAITPVIDTLSRESGVGKGVTWDRLIHGRDHQTIYCPRFVSIVVRRVVSLGEVLGERGDWDAAHGVFVLLLGGPANVSLREVIARRAGDIATKAAAIGVPN
jgi:hypothetical protein